MPCWAMMQPIRKRDQQHDRHGLPADAVEMMHRRGQAEAARMQDDADQRGGQRAQHLGEGGHVGRKPGKARPTLSSAADSEFLR